MPKLLSYEHKWRWNPIWMRTECETCGSAKEADGGYRFEECFAEHVPPCVHPNRLFGQYLSQQEWAEYQNFLTEKTDLLRFPK